MDGTTLLSLGFCEWRPFKKETIKIAPEHKGVYAFRSLTSLGLKVGSSDIMYIGRAKGEGKKTYTIKRGLNQYLHPGHGNRTKIRVGQKAKDEGWEVSWMVTDSPDQMECHLLRQFYRDHGQKPPENRSWPEGCMPEQ